MRAYTPTELRRVIPPSGFIKDYVEYASYCTDAPEIYHIGCAAVVLSTLMADRVRLITGKTEENLNLWVMISGRSSRDRKSTSVRIARDFISGIAPQRLAPTSGSVEGLLQRLVEEPCSVFLASELAALLDQMEASYWRQGRSLLMDLYDGGDEFTRQLINREPIVVYKPRISVLAASAATLLEQTTRSTDWTGGFLARFLVLYAERSRFLEHRRDNPHLRSKAADSLQQALDYPRGYMQVTDEGLQEHGRFSRWLNEKTDRSPEHLHGLITRLNDHVLRIAGLYALSLGVNTDLGRSTMRRAAAFGRIAYKSIGRIADRVTRDPRMKMRARIMNLVNESPGGITTRDILRQTHFIKRDTLPIFETLLAEGVIEIEQRGRKEIVYPVYEKKQKPRRELRKKKRQANVIPMFKKSRKR